MIFSNKAIPTLLSNLSSMSVQVTILLNPFTNRQFCHAESLAMDLVKVHAGCACNLEFQPSALLTNLCFITAGLDAPPFFPPPPLRFWPHPLNKQTTGSSHLSSVCLCVQVTAQLSGWRANTGLLLREPATASVDYTPSLAKYVSTHPPFPFPLSPLPFTPVPIHCLLPALPPSFHLC